MSRLADLFVSKSPETSEEVDPPPGELQKKPNYGILFVDDEANVLAAMKRIFRKENYRIYTAASGDDALSILSENPIQVVISDHRMPGMSGAELLREVKKAYPATIRIMLTGYADVQAVMGAVNEGAVYKFITKPWNDDDLRITVSLALEQYDLIQENQTLKVERRKREKQIKRLSRFVNTHRSQIGVLLLKKGKLTENQYAILAEEQEKTGAILPEIIIRRKMLSESELISILIKALKINRVDPASFVVPGPLADLLSLDICRKNKLVPLKRVEGRLLVAMADPTDQIKIEDLKFVAGLPIEPAIATQKEISDKIDEIYGNGNVFSEITADFDIWDPSEAIEIVLDDDEEDIPVEELLAAKDKPPAIRIVNAILSDALRHGASDIHIEPKAQYVKVRYRVDGLLQDKIHIPPSMHAAIVSRIKVMAELDISERRRPQDGRVTARSSTRTVDMRLSTLPTINGEKVVLRILDRNASIRDVSELGFSESDLNRIEQMISLPQGCILTTGPTGSGKTSTLYSLLQKNALDTRNYVTIEDPVEYFMAMAEQVMVRDKIGLTFPKVLRAILRQDPNVIMLGEIRDLETAEVAFNAALTGHTVLSTLHTNGSIAAVTRLRDMGIPPYVISDALSGIIAQRLVRKLCPDCREPYHPDADVLTALNLNANTQETLYRAVGCEKCSYTGYRGRIGLFEVLTITGPLKSLIHGTLSETALLAEARWSGMRTLFEDGCDKMRSGLTSPDEIQRVLGSQHLNRIACPSCGYFLEERKNFCHNCGERLIQECANCKMPVEIGWGYCPECGSQLE